MPAKMLALMLTDTHNYSSHWTRDITSNKGHFAYYTKQTADWTKLAALTSKTRPWPCFVVY